MNVRELLNRLDEIAPPAPPAPPAPVVPPAPVPPPDPERERLERLRRTHGLSAAPATGDKAKLQELQALVDQYLSLKNNTPVKESELAKSLMESFGYQYLAELAIGDNVTASNGVQYRLRVDPTSGQWYWGDRYNHPPKDPIKFELVQKYPEVKVRMPDAEIARLEKTFAPKVDTSIKAPEIKAPEVNPETIKNTKADAKALKGSKALGRGLTILAIAAEVYDGYEQIKAIPKDTPKDQYKAEVTKIVTDLVVNFGLFYVGMILGGLIAGVITGGPGGIVGMILGGALGWAASKYGGEKGIDPLINDIIDRMYGVKGDQKNVNPQSSAEKVTWPTTVDAIKQFQSTHKDENGNPLTADGLIGRYTLAALKAAGAEVPAGFVPVRDRNATSNVSRPNPNNTGPNSSAQAQTPNQLATLKTQIQQGLKELSNSANPTIRNQVQALKTKLGPEFSAQ